MRSLAILPVCLLTLGLAGCGGSDDAGPSMVERPALKATCTLQAPAGSRAYDSGYGVVSLSDQQKVEVTGANQDEIRARLAALGVGTKAKPCATLNIEHLDQNQ